MAEAVRTKRAFLGAGAYIVTPERIRVVNFTIPVSVEPYTFLLARPRELSRALLFLSPFTGNVKLLITQIFKILSKFQTWLCILIGISVMGPLLNCFHRLTPFYDHFQSRGTGGLQSLTNCLWYMYGALLQQGGT